MFDNVSGKIKSFIEIIAFIFICLLCSRNQYRGTESKFLLQIKNEEILIMEYGKVFGTLERVVLGNKIEFIDDSIEVWVEIKEVSDNLQSKICQAVEEVYQ